VVHDSGHRLTIGRARDSHRDRRRRASVSLTHDPVGADPLAAMRRLSHGTGGELTLMTRLRAHERHGLRGARRARDRRQRWDLRRPRVGGRGRGAQERARPPALRRTPTEHSRRQTHERNNAWQASSVSRRSRTTYETDSRAATHKPRSRETPVTASADFRFRHALQSEARPHRLLPHGTSSRTTARPSANSRIARHCGSRPGHVGYLRHGTTAPASPAPRSAAASPWAGGNHGEDATMERLLNRRQHLPTSGQRPVSRVPCLPSPMFVTPLLRTQRKAVGVDRSGPAMRSTQGRRRRSTEAWFAPLDRPAERPALAKTQLERLAPTRHGATRSGACS
jgi:hypothetical protein